MIDLLVYPFPSSNATRQQLKSRLLIPCTYFDRKETCPINKTATGPKMFWITTSAKGYIAPFIALFP